MELPASNIFWLSPRKLPISTPNRSASCTASSLWYQDTDWFRGWPFLKGIGIFGVDGDHVA
jgi:hypothetical protein